MSRSTSPPSSTPTATTSASGGQKSRAPPSQLAARDQGTRLPGQLQPPGPLHQSRPAGRRPAAPVPRRAARLLLTRPDRLTGSQQETLARIETACPEISALASHIRDFAALLVPDPGNAGRLQEWIIAARAADLPHVHAFTRGLDLDIQAAAAALTLPFHNGRTEGVNTKTKMIKRQMYGRAGFALLRHRILLGLRNDTTGSETEPLKLQSPFIHPNGMNRPRRKSVGGGALGLCRSLW